MCDHVSEGESERQRGGGWGSDLTGKHTQTQYCYLVNEVAEELAIMNRRFSQMPVFWKNVCFCMCVCVCVCVCVCLFVFIDIST